MPFACFLIGLACGLAGAYLFGTRAQSERNESVQMVTGGRNGASPAGTGPSEAAQPPQSKVLARDRQPQQMPTLGEVSEGTLRGLKLSCLGPDMKINPMLKELAGLSDAQFTDLQTLVDDIHALSLAREAERFVAIPNSNETAVVIPPDKATGQTLDAAYRERLEKLVGPGREQLVRVALERGVKQATGNFGQLIRRISFEPKADADGKITNYRARISVLDPKAERLIQSGEWAALGAYPAAEMTSFEFHELPSQFKNFVESGNGRVP